MSPTGQGGLEAFLLGTAPIGQSLAYSEGRTAGTSALSLHLMTEMGMSCTSLEGAVHLRWGLGHIAGALVQTQG